MKMTHKRFGFLSRTLLVAALVVAAASVLGMRSARANAPLPAGEAAQAEEAARNTAWLVMSHGMGNPAMGGATTMQVLWGGIKGGSHGPNAEQDTARTRHGRSSVKKVQENR